MCVDHGVPNEFRGNDRRLLEKLRKCIKLIKKRDVRAANPRPTSAISNREPIIDPANPTLAGALEAIDEHACELLGCNDFIPF